MDKTCVWTFDEDGFYVPSCDPHRAFEFADGGPVENHFAFCPYCGRALEVSAEPGESEDDCG